jgi:adenylylsulfate kinase (apsK)
MKGNLLSNEPIIALDGARLDALELILSGLLAPIDGYCLPGEKPAAWPFEAIIDVTAADFDAAKEAVSVIFTDPDGTPLARLEVSAAAFPHGGTAHLAGTLSSLGRAEHPPARPFRLTAGGDLRGSTVAVFAGDPDPSGIARAIVRAGNGPLVFLAVAWNRGQDDYGILRTLEILQHCAEAIPGSSVRVLLASALHPEMQRAALVDYVLSSLRPRRVLDFSSSDHDPAPAAGSQQTAGGGVVLLTGLSGSGKSTVARGLMERLSSQGDRRPVLLDGDDVRRVLSAGLGFSAEDRESNLRRIGWVAAKIASVGGLAICAPIAPFERTRSEMRAMAEGASRFVLVYVATPLAVCEARDRKGLYARARAGQIADFTGIDSPYEVPTDADLVIDTSTMVLEECVDAIVTTLTRSA